MYSAAAENISFDTTYSSHWSSSVHMKNFDARIFLEITDVHIENLQEITEESAIAEGYFSSTFKGQSYSSIDNFRAQWNKKIKYRSDSDKYTWDANPYVWVITFQLCKSINNFSEFIHKVAESTNNI